MKRLVLLVLLAACEEAPERFPIVPGGGGSGTSSRPDAALDAPGDASALITGRVCLLVTDVDTLVNCAPAGAGGFTVTLGPESATTADDGSFTLMRPANAMDLVWRVSGTGIIPSAMKFGTTTLLPAVDAAKYDDMVVATQPTLASGNGAIMMRVSRAGAPVAGVTVVAPGAQEIFYDGPDDLTWLDIATGEQGVTWIPSIGAGTAQLTITANETDTVVPDVPVFAETITFVFAEIL